MRVVKRIQAKVRDMGVDNGAGSGKRHVIAENHMSANWWTGHRAWLLGFLHVVSSAVAGVPQHGSMSAPRRNRTAEVRNIPTLESSRGPGSALAHVACPPHSSPFRSRLQATS